MNISAIIVAAGSSQRMGTDKMLLPLLGKSVILHTIEKFALCDEIDEIIVVASKNNIDLSAYNTLKFKIDLIYTNKDYANWLYKDNYMELLEGMRSKMKTEGIDELINEINRQLDEAQK